MKSLDRIRARAALYHLLALLVDHPVPELYEGLVNGDFQNAVRNQQNLLGLQVAQLSRLTGSFQEYEADYISWFEVGARVKPRFSLQASAYMDAVETDERAEGTGQRTALFQVLLRFYHHFGMRITENAEERVLPDHLSCELEIMSFLCFREAEALLSKGGSVSYLRAQHDFLERHLAIWVPRLQGEIEASSLRTENERFIYAAVRQLGELINSHLAESEKSLRQDDGVNAQVLHIHESPISKLVKATASRTVS